MINLNKINLTFGTRDIYKDVSASFSENEKIGLVGLNGAGKSTLLKVIAGRQKLDSGTISIQKNRKIAYLPQDIILTSKKSILGEALEAFEDLYKLQDQQKVLEDKLKISQNSYVVEQYADICTKLAEHDIDAKIAEAKRVLLGLGFKENQFDKPVSTLSGGWKMRIVLANLLLKKADFYLFDEPTNHLDIVAKDWFLNFLARANFGFLLVCHERYVLNKLCTKIVDVEFGTLKIYNGSYAQYEVQKEQDLKALEIAYQQQQREIKQKTATAQRFKAKASKAAMAKSILKKIDKIEKIELPPSAKSVNFKFDDLERVGRIVLKVKDVSHAYGPLKIFKNVSCEIERGERVALVAPNGVGKTTLFNLVAGKLPLKDGVIELGSKVVSAIYEQEQDNWLDSNLTIIENLEASCHKTSEAKMRSLLGGFLFSGDDVYKKAGFLSGGEKSRIGMVRLLLQDANFLLLDEPTNHLDIISKDILLKALNGYPGTMFFVSHDHDFINKLATRIIELTPHGAISYQGDYDAYLYAKSLQENKSEKKTSSLIENKKQKNTNKELYALRKKLGALERKIETLEKKKIDLENAFENLLFDTPEFNNEQKKMQAIVTDLNQCMKEWEKIVSQLN